MARVRGALFWFPQGRVRLGQPLLCCLASFWPPSSSGTESYFLQRADLFPRCIILQQGAAVGLLPPVLPVRFSTLLSSPHIPWHVCRDIASSRLDGKLTLESVPQSPLSSPPLTFVISGRLIAVFSVSVEYSLPTPVESCSQVNVGLSVASWVSCPTQICVFSQIWA
jgi:hypothetical protein